MKTNRPFRVISQRRALSAAIALCAGGVCSGAALADAARQAALSTSLEEIVVQAQRKAELAQDVPLSVVAISSAAMESQGVLSLAGLNNMIPNAVIERVGIFPRAASLSMRGVGYSGIESFTDPQVAVYVNGVYQARNAIALGSSLDIASIEVLRGPQGTLYGRNALAGAVAVHSNLPEFDAFKGKATMTLGNYGRQDSELMLNMPLSDTMAFRVAARLHTLDGYYKNDGYVERADGSLGFDRTLRGKSLGGEKNLYLRPTFTFAPSDDLQTTFFGEFYRERSDPNVSLNGPLDGSQASGTIWRGKNPFGDEKHHVSSDGSNPFSTGNSLAGRPNDIDSFSLTNETVFTTGLGEFKTILNYQDTEEDVWTDGDGSNANIFSSGRYQDYKAYSAELQFMNSYDKLDVIAGLFYLHDEYQTSQLTFTSAPTGTPPRYTVDEFSQFTVDPAYINNEGKRNSISAYAQFEYHLTDELSFVAGGRYSYEKKYDAKGQNSLLSVAGIPQDQDFSKHVYSSNPALVFGPLSEDWDNFAPRLGVNYTVSPDLLLFAFWQKAFKSGGFNANSNDRTAFYTPYGEEEVDNYEIGMKSDWLDGRLRVNANVFYSEFTGLQRSLVTPSSTSPSGVTTVTTNAADMRSYGVEAEISALLAPGFSTFLNIGWNKAEYTSYCAPLAGVQATPTPSGREICGPVQQAGAGYVVPQDYSDLDPIRAPRWDVSTGFTKTFLFDRGSIDWTGKVNYRSGMYTHLLNAKYSYRPDMTTVDTSLTWNPDQGNYTVTLWGNNLTNKVEILNYLPLGNTTASINPTDPRTYGVTVSLNF